MVEWQDGRAKAMSFLELACSHVCQCPCHLIFRAIGGVALIELIGTLSILYRFYKIVDKMVIASNPHSSCSFVLECTASSFPSSCYLFIIYLTEGRHASVEVHEAVDHQTSFMSSREEFSHPGIEPSTSSLRFGYLSTII